MKLIDFPYLKKKKKRIFFFEVLDGIEFQMF